MAGERMMGRSRKITTVMLSLQINGNKQLSGEKHWFDLGFVALITSTWHTVYTAASGQWESGLRGQGYERPVHNEGSLQSNLLTIASPFQSAMHLHNQLKINTSSSISGIIHQTLAVHGPAGGFSHQNQIFMLENKCQIRSNLAWRLAKGLERAPYTQTHHDGISVIVRFASYVPPKRSPGKATYFFLKQFSCPFWPTPEGS